MPKTRITVVQNSTTPEALAIEFMHWWCARDNNRAGYTTTLGTMSIDLSLLRPGLAICSECGKGLGTQR